MTNPLPGLLDAICREPGDDGLRLIYADWLEQNGQEERGEFLRVQIELAKLGPKRRVHRGFPRRIGADYVEIPTTTNDEFKVGERVDLIDGVARKVRMFRGLLVTKIVPDADTSLGSLTVVLKRDGFQCDPKREKFLRRHEQELLNDHWSQWVHDVFDSLAYDVGVATSGSGTRFKVSLYDRHAGEQGHLECDFHRGFVSEIRCSLEMWCGEECPRCQEPFHYPANCPDCHGSGRINAHAGKLVAAAPLERVVLTDREPLDPEHALGNKWCWEPGINEYSLHHIPMWLVKSPDPDVSFVNGLMLFQFDSREAAVGWLSTRLLAWARAIAFPDLE